MRAGGRVVVVAGRLVKPAAPQLHPAALSPRRRADPGASSHPGHTAPSPGWLPRPSLLAVSPQTTSGMHRIPCGSALNRPRTNTPACRGPGGCTHPASCTCQPSACRGTWLRPASRFRRYLPGEAGLCQRTRDREPCALTRPRVKPSRPSGRRSAGAGVWVSLLMALGSPGRSVGESPHLPRHPTLYPLGRGARGVQTGQGNISHHPLSPWRKASGQTRQASPTAEHSRAPCRSER